MINRTPAFVSTSASELWIIAIVLVCLAGCGAKVIVDSTAQCESDKPCLPQDAGSPDAGAPGGTGSPCMVGSDCLSGICDNLSCKPGEAGSLCMAGSDCQSGICDNLACKPAQVVSGPLDWLTTVVATKFQSGRIRLTGVVVRDDGSIFVNGTEEGDLTILGTEIKAPCCWDQIFGMNFNAAGGPTDVDFFVCANGFQGCRRSIRKTQGDVQSLHYDYFTMGAEPRQSASIVKKASPHWSRGVGRIRDFAGNAAGQSVIVGSPFYIDSPIDYGDGVSYADTRLVKFDSSGGVALNSPFVEPFGAQSLELASNGEVYVSARANGTLTIQKFDALGAKQWTKTSPMPIGLDAMESIEFAIDASDNLLLAFNFNGTVNLGNLPMTSIGPNDLGLAKIDLAGNIVWQQQFGSATFNLKQVRVTSTGVSDMVVAGFYTGSTNLGNGALQHSIFITKFDNNGNAVWQANLDDTEMSVALSGNNFGEVFVASGSNKLDFGWGPPLGGMDKRGVMLAKYRAQ